MAVNLHELAQPDDLQQLTIRVRDILMTILETGDIVGRDEHGRTVLQLALDEIQIEELAIFGAELEDLEPEPLDDDRGV